MTTIDQAFYKLVDVREQDQKLLHAHIKLTHARIQALETKLESLRTVCRGLAVVLLAYGVVKAAGWLFEVTR